MTFTTPGMAVAGLIAAAIPIIIHLLFRQRRKPVQWAAMRFLLEAYRKQRSRLRLQQWLLLLTRCLLLAAVGVALARPILEDAGLLDADGQRVIFIVIDNGVASQVESNADETSFDRHRKEALQIVRALDPADAISVIGAAQPAASLVASPTTDQPAIANLLEELTPTSAATDVPAALALLHDELETALERFDSALVYVLSDFREGSLDLERSAGVDFGAMRDRITLMVSPAASEAVENVQVVAVDPMRSFLLPGAVDGSGRVVVRLRREGGLGESVSRVTLTGTNLPAMAPEMIDWSAGQIEASASLMLDARTAGEQMIGLSATIEPDALSADDARHTVLSVRRQVRVVLLERRGFAIDQGIDQLSSGGWIRRALELDPDGPVQLIEIEPASLSPIDLRLTDAVILTQPDLLQEPGWRLLRQFVDAGNLLLVMPPADATVHRWPELMAETLRAPWQIARETVDNVDGLLAADQPSDSLLRVLSSELDELVLPVVVQRSLPVTGMDPSARSVLQMANDSPLLVVGPAGAGDMNDDAGDAANGDAGSEGEGDDAAGGLVMYLSTAPQLSWTNLPTKPLMVPLMQELLRQGLSEVRASREVSVGAQRGLLAPPSATALASLDAEEHRIGFGMNRVLDQPIAQPGVYAFADRRGETLGLLAVNVNAQAARITPQSQDAVTGWFASSGPWQVRQAERITETLADAESPSSIGRWLLLAALALFLLETLLARWFSHAQRGPGGRGGIGRAAGDERIIEATIEAKAMRPTIGSHAPEVVT